jgi:threonine dehydratase
MAELMMQGVAELPGLKEIEAAGDLVYRHMRPTPQYSWPLINERAGAEVWVKHENHTPIGAFKVRGGIVYMDWLRRTHPEVTTIISATRGNHGQSLAYAGVRAGLHVVLLVPKGNSREKNRAMEALGAEVVESGSDFQESSEHAIELELEQGWHRVPSYDVRLVTGVATYALEMLRGCPELERVYVPVGMGSGASGMIAARNALRLRTKIVGVVSSLAPAFALSYEAGRVKAHASETFIADGIACRLPDARMVEVGRAGLERVMMVDENEVEAAMRAYFADTHNVAEGAGAIGLAALLKDKQRGSGRVGTVMTGGNVDSDVFARVLGAEEKLRFRRE